MSIFERIQRIARANINWLLNKVEPAEQELQSRIAELGSAIAEGRECAASYGATFRRMQQEQQSLQHRRQQCQQTAQAALQAGDEAAARAALAEKVRLGERLAALEPGIEQGRLAYEQLRRNIASLQDQLNAARLKLAELRSRKRSAEAHKAFGTHLEKTHSLSPQGDALDRLEDQVQQAEAEAQVAEEIRSGAMSETDLQQRCREFQVEAELRAMKQQLGKD